MVMPKPPEACRDLSDIRAGIDHLDFQIVEILTRRMSYVKAAAQFKPSEESIPAPERVAAMLEERRLWAERAGLPQEAIAVLFPGLIEWFIQQQILHWRTTRLDGNEAQA